MGSVISQFVFLPPKTPSYNSTKPYKVTEIITETQKVIPAYYIPAKSKFGVTSTTILYSHGNASDIGLMIDFLAILHEYLPVNILHYEYIGYGLALKYGPASEKSTYESAEAAFQYLIKEKKIKESDIIVMGTSVGSGPSCELAVRHPNIKGLILECPFLSVLKVVASKRGVIARQVDLFQNNKKISKVQCPVYVLHGTNDQVVPFKHGVALYNKVRDECKFEPSWVENAGHSDILEKMTIEGYISKMLKFLKHVDEFQKKKGVQ